MILSCSGWACTRLIAVSKVPGGNPAALMDPEGFAAKFMICEDCGDDFCDRCHAIGTRFRAPRCPHCGGKLASGTELEQLSGHPRPAAVEHYRSGVELVQSGRFQDAARELDEAVRLHPGYAAAHQSRGIALVESGRPGEALASFEEALRLNPSDVESHFQKARALAALERTAEALAAYEETIVLEPRYPPPHINWALIRMRGGNGEAALTAIDRLIALITAGRSVGGRRYDLAHAHTVKGAALANLGRYAEALPVIEHAIDNGADSWHDHYNKAYVLEHLGRLEEAEAARSIGDSLRDS